VGSFAGQPGGYLIVQVAALYRAGLA